MNTKLKKTVHAVSVLAFNLAHAQEALPTQDQGAGPTRSAPAQDSAAAAAPAPATAAPATAATPTVLPNQVLVTGSRIVHRDAQASGPMITMNREDLKFAAPTSVGDMIQALPNAGVSLNS